MSALLDRPAALRLPPSRGLRVAIVHEWLERYGGSERVLEQLLACWPQADLFALVDFVPAAERGFLGGRPVRTSFIQRLPLARRRFRLYLGLMPIAVEQFDLSGYDLVISSNHAVAKGVITGPDQVHVSYVHSPMRYAWDLQPRYLHESGMQSGLRGLYARWLLHRLRLWDTRSAAGVDVFVANSTYIVRRIRKAYRRVACVVPPPVAVERFALGAGPRHDYVVVARFVPYKRVDLVVAAFAGLPGRRLIVVGDGPGAAAVARAAADCPNIAIRRPLPAAELIALLQGARASVVAAEEDFGIAMVEAQACGTPVIAYGSGGARDIVVDADAEQPTGVLFNAQTVEAIRDAVRRFESLADRISPQACRRNALRFSEVAFRARMADVVAEALAAADRRVPPDR